MDPNDPWAIPPAATAGDPTNTILFTAVGQALSSWEWVEGHLGMLFGEFVAPGRPALAASRAYGIVSSSRGRADMLRQAADAYFSIHPDEAMQTAFKAQMNVLDRAAPRRNDIAHGIVQPFDFGREASTWALYPSYYASARRKLDGTERYVMTAKDISRFGRQFADLQPPIIEIIDRVHERHVRPGVGRR